MGKRLKNCSTSTDVEATTEPSQSDKESNDLEPQVILKKQKKVEATTEPSQIGSDDLEPQQILKKQKKVKQYDCNYENEDAYGNDDRTILVRGLDCSLSTDDLKSALKEHFGSCGEISRVFVPIECKTGSPFGTAYINLDIGAEKKALLLDGTYLGSQRLQVVMARRGNQSAIDPNFKECERCVIVRKMRLHKNFILTNGGRRLISTPLMKSMIAELEQKSELQQKAEAKKHI